MLYMKACPRCHGDIKLDRDTFGVFAKCLQCGFNKDFVTKRQTLAPAVAPLAEEVEAMPAFLRESKAA
jgi:hypothetical protein